MKRDVLTQLALTGTLLLSMACSSEETTKQEPAKGQQDTKELTAFVVEDNSTKTRTTAEYDGSGLNFYWTEGDRLWVNNGTLIQDVSNTINKSLVNNPTITNAVKRTATARFQFAGTFTALSYPVRYTGKGSTDGNKVTIKAAQTQAIPNDASHVAESGDCGIATAIKSGEQYNFTLEHKAAYLTFVPYSSQGAVSGAIITQIKVTADKAVCGQFDFNDNGIDVDNSRPTTTPTNQSITLTLNSNATNTGFPIPANVVDASKNAAVMVLAPGTYSTFTVEYTLHDNVTNKGGIITKTYNNLTLTAGKNRRVATNLQVLDYSSWIQYRKWTAAGSSTAPTVNELVYYMIYGNPHYDYNVPWACNGHLYSSGLWLKKQAVIYNDLKAAGYNQLTSQAVMKNRYYPSPTHAGFDFRITRYQQRIYPPSGTPISTTDYFFLPSLGALVPGNGAPFGSHGLYWSSNATPDEAMFAYTMHFFPNFLDVNYTYKDSRQCIARPFE